MVQGLAALLLFQSLGEAVAHFGGLPVPGPVIGLVALLLVLLVRRRWRPAPWAALEQAADGLLAHLSIFFIPAAVGVMLYWEPLVREGLAWVVALVASTAAALAVTALFLARRFADPRDDEHDGAAR